MVLIIKRHVLTTFLSFIVIQYCYLNKYKVLFIKNIVGSQRLSELNLLIIIILNKNTRRHVALYDLVISITFFFL